MAVKVRKSLRRSQMRLDARIRDWNATQEDMKRGKGNPLAYRKPGSMKK